MKLKHLVSVLSLGVIATLSSASALAADSATAITINDIRFSSAGQLFLNTSDGWFWAAASADGSACPAPSIDIRKTWLAMAQSALLSGKKLHIVYATCASGHKGISEMWQLNY